MSETGLESLYRLLCEPQRLWKRYLIDDIPLFWLILKNLDFTKTLGCKFANIKVTQFLVNKSIGKLKS
jgi:hypothetical protein